jgi:glycosyltransferase involved in cell wall biosynthesis
MDGDLWVVMPVYNEGPALEAALREWTAAVRAVVSDARFCVVDDGSTDETPAVLARCVGQLPGLRVLGQPNRGHGQACLAAYRAALGGGAGWVLQVDSDGQCDARHFGALWAARHAAPAVLGCRRRRADGLARTLVSGVLALVVRAGTGRWLRDANSPYRLMRSDVLTAALARIPADVSLANVLVAVDLETHTTIRWVDVGFRARARPTPIRPRYFVMQARRLWRDLRRYREAGMPRGGRSATSDP